MINSTGDKGMNTSGCEHRACLACMWIVGLCTRSSRGLVWWSDHTYIDRLLIKRVKTTSTNSVITLFNFPLLFFLQSTCDIFW